MGLNQPEWQQGKRRANNSGRKVCLPGAALVLAGVAVLGLTGCEDSARNPATAYHPVPIPSIARPNLDSLPLNSSHWRVASLAVALPNGVELLARQAEAALEAGERDFQRGDWSGARLEFAEGLSVLQESGFDVQSEPRLADLFSRLVET